MSAVIAAVISALIDTSNRRSGEGYLFFVEQPTLESSQFLFIFLIEDDGNSVDLLGVMREEGFHKGVVEGIAKI